MPAPVKARSRTKKVKRKARSLPYDGSLYSSILSGIVTTHSYEPNRNLLTSIVDAKDGTTLSHKAYSYDLIARPTTRQINERADTFAYNAKSELTAAQLGSDNYGYAYDNIGNRKTAQEIAEEITYATNSANEYTAINDFTPEFDADGNQTRLQTSTGIWTVEYNAENRPTKFTSEDSSTIVEARYDYMGRRAWKKVTINGTITSFEAYVYRGYLQIAAESLLGGQGAIHFVTWDPTQPTSTRSLALEKHGTWFTYGLDLSKNVTELYTSEGTIATSYSYSPFGAVEATGETANPIQWSSEVYDSELALVYYNYRHYNPTDGRWINRDPIVEEGGLNLYGFVGNTAIIYYDLLGLELPECEDVIQGAASSTGVQVLRLGHDRSMYSEEVKNIPKEDSHRRTQFKRSHRRQISPLGRSWTRQILEQQRDVRRAARARGETPPNRKNNAGKSNAGVDRIGKCCKCVGRACFVVTAVIEAKNIYDAPEDEKFKETTRAGGRVGGAIVGGIATGAALGALGANPITIGIDAAVGGITGTIGGEAAVDYIWSFFD